jgi:hypothetical protein
VLHRSNAVCSFSLLSLPLSLTLSLSLCRYVNKAFVKPLDPALDVWREASQGNYAVVLAAVAARGTDGWVRSAAAAAAVAATARLGQDHGAAEAPAEEAGEVRGPRSCPIQVHK